MADSEFLRIIDARVQRTNEFLEADRKARERAAGEHGQGLQDVRVELRQMSLRGERLAQSYLRRLEEMSEEGRAESARNEAAMGALTAEIREQSAQIRANTRAVLSLLDERFGGGPATA
jgi:tRNA A37 N6-isopentenylltransferase MiaA